MNFRRKKIGKEGAFPIQKKSLQTSQNGFPKRSQGGGEVNSHLEFFLRIHSNLATKKLILFHSFIFREMRLQF